MADNNDEYEFSDLDMVTPDPMADDDLLSNANFNDFGAPPEKTNVIRNAIIVVAIVIIAMMSYKFIAKSPAVEELPAIPEIVPPKPIIIPEPVRPVAQPVSVQPDPQLAQRIASVEANQQTMQTDIININTQLDTLNNKVNDLDNKINTLSQLVATLAEKVDQQSTQIANLLVVRQAPAPKPRPQPVVKPRAAAALIYYIQAVIPGRAWLIATNGSTITVREGTKIAGYGTVKLIDPNQGRVLMSSGKVIRFSQQDS